MYLIGDRDSKQHKPGTNTKGNEKRKKEWHTPQTLSRHEVSRTMIASCQAGHYTRPVKGRPCSSFSFLSAIDGNYTLYSLVLRGTPAIIALCFCSAIRKAFTCNRVRKRDRKELVYIIKQMRLIAEFVTHSETDTRTGV